MIMDVKNQRKIINEAILSLSAISEENAASSQEVMANIENLNTMILVVDDKASELKNMNEELNNLILMFKLQNEENK